MEKTERQFLDKDGLAVLISLLKSAHYTKDEVNSLLKSIGAGGGGTGEGGSYDDTLLRQWIETNYIKKGTNSNSLIQGDGKLRNIYDGDSLTNGGLTDIPTLRSITNELSKYLKDGEIDLKDYEKTSDLQTKLTNLKSEILGGAGEDYDTLKEIEEWVKEHQDLYEALISTVAQKATKEEVESKADKTSVDEEFVKVTEELGKKCNIVICDSQYDFDNILTKDNNTIYLIKGDQDVWAAKDYVDELFELVVDLRSRITKLEADGDGINEEEPSVS